MKIRVLSDLHLDVNADYDFKLKDKDIFTVIAGDTSGDSEMTEKWIKKNVKRGIFISGNHLVYNNKYKLIQELRDELHAAFPIDSDITYLDNECGVLSKVVDGILFIGTTLYTDYRYSAYDTGSDVEKIALNKAYGQRGLNDFRYGMVKPGQFMTSYDYADWFVLAWKNIERLVVENEADKNLPVILVTHHCISPKCISSKYVDSELNASYVSDKEDFIRNHPSIKCVISGHVHHQTDFSIDQINGEKCLYVLNPRGYCMHCEDIPDFNANTFVDTDTWTLTKEPKSKSLEEKEKRRLRQYTDKYAKLSRFFI